VQHGEKQENEDAVGNAARKLRPRLKQFEKEWVRRRISIQGLEVQQETADCRKGREMRTRAENDAVAFVVLGVAKLRAKFFLNQAKGTAAVGPLAHDRSPGVWE
jgi:hypothetical protein